MIKNISQLKCMIDNKEFVFQCDPDSSLNLCKEAIFQFQKYIGQIEDAAKKSLEENEKKEDISEVQDEIKTEELF